MVMLSNCLVAAGGSRISNWSTKTSDLDYFIISDNESLTPDLINYFPAADVEIRSLAWLDEICKSLAQFKPVATPALPPFSYSDLRFLARVLRGQILTDRLALRSSIATVESGIRVAMAQLNGAIYHNVYQDFYGLWEDGRSDECMFMAGHLAHRACLQAVIQSGLVDPSPKWGLRQALQHGNIRVRKAALSLVNTIRLITSSQDNDATWGLDFLCLTRKMISIGVLIANNAIFTEQAESKGISQHDLRASLCFLGTPGYTVAVDVVTREAFVFNQAQLISWAEGNAA